MHLHSQSAFSDVDKASLLNVFFESIYSKSDDNQPPADSSPVDTLGLINITDLDVYTLLTSLNPTKAQGIDGIGPKILRSCAPALYVVIHHLFTMSLWYCKIPSEWKVHCIVPIYKSGDKISHKLPTHLTTMLYLKSSEALNI